MVAAVGRSNRSARKLAELVASGRARVGFDEAIPAALGEGTEDQMAQGSQALQRRLPGRSGNGCRCRRGVSRGRSFASGRAAWTSEELGQKFRDSRSAALVW